MIAFVYVMFSMPSSKELNIIASNETILLLIKFRIYGNFRFLSHAETVMVFRRACVRSGIEITYSQGFNPRPRLSLPLPRSVGVESDDELLCLRVPGAASSFDAEGFMAKLSSQLPDGCEVLSVRIAETRRPLQPCSAAYLLQVREEYLNEKLKTTIETVLASKNLNIQRQTDKKGNFRTLDVRPFLESIELDGCNISVECKIDSSGSIRVDEILRLLQLETEKLAASIRRTNVKWKKI